MVINVNDTEKSSNMLYYQSLCLLYLPCEHFSENDTQNRLFVDACKKDGILSAHVKLIVGEKVSETQASEIVDSTKHRQMKNLIGRTVVSAFERIFHIKPPWGISTGVKPVKLAREYIKAYGEDIARDILINDYMFDSRKAKLSIEASRHEDMVIGSLPEKSCSLYVSIPFCPTRCDYCSFVSYTTPRLLELIPDYLTRLYEDIEACARVIKNCELSLKSVYIGGGTPSVLSESQIYSLLECLNKNIGDFRAYEFTFEAGRPDCITESKLKVLHDFGIGRISINTQSANDEVLKNVGRNHTFKQFLDSFEAARKIGFDCINTDLIAGLPTDTCESFRNSVDEISKLKPENITVHAFTLKKSSKFKTDGKTDITSSYKMASDMLDYSADKLDSLGYSPYYVYRQKNTVGNLDNTGYALPCFESIYNLVMMGEHHTVLAAGAGAVTKLVPDNKYSGSIKRIFAPKYPYEYLDRQKYIGYDEKAVTEFYSSEREI